MNDIQIRRNQDVFREVNQRIADITRGQSEAGSEFLCECGRGDCTMLLNLSLTDYESARSDPQHFLVRSGHCVEGVDRIVDSRDGFDLVVQV